MPPARIPISQLKHRNGDYYARRGEVGQSDDEPVCPKWMVGIAKREWNRVVEDMRERNFLSASYQTSLEIYCQAYAEWREAIAVLKKDGTTVFRESRGGGYTTHHPMVKQRDDACKKIFDAMREFGMTPASKSRVVGVKSKDAPKPVQSRREGLGVVG